MRLGEYLKEIQNLPLIKRKVIFWIVITIFGLILFAFYVINIQQKIEAFPTEKSLEELKLPELKEGLEKLPKLDIDRETKELKGDIGEIERLIEETKKEEEQN